MTPLVQRLTSYAYQMARSALNGTDAEIVQLKDGGVLITSPDGDHVHIYVSSVHFEPGEAVPF